MMTNLSHKKVLITGAAGGIGSAIVQKYLKQHDEVIAIDSSMDALTELCKKNSEYKTKLLPLQLDVRDAIKVKETFSQLFVTHNDIDTFVSCVGGSRYDSYHEINVERWREEVELNLNAVYYTTDSVIKYFESHYVTLQSPSIVFISSVNGLAFYGNPAYSAAKSGIISLAKSLAAEYGKYNIRVNVVCPGSVKTKAWDYRLQQNPTIIEEISKHYPLGRIVEPDEVANAVVFLTSEMASGITGTTLTVDCGLNVGNVYMLSELARLK